MKMLLTIAAIQAIGWLAFWFGRRYERARLEIEAYRGNPGRDFIRPSISFPQNLSRSLQPNIPNRKASP